jgi:hypothetical protein
MSDVKRSIFPVPIRVRIAVSSNRKSEIREKRSAGSSCAIGGDVLAAMAELSS